MPKEIIDLPLQGRMASVRAGSIDEAARTVEIIWTTGATVRRARFWDEAVDEELSLDPGMIRLDRLNAGAPFLNAHDAGSLASVLGVVVDGSARIANGQGTATIRFSERADVEPIFRDIAGGIIRNVSVGYRVHRYEITKRDGAPELWRAVDWEPLEISAVAIGADPGARVRSDTGATRALNICTLIRTSNPDTEAPMPDDIEPTAPSAAPAPATRAIDPTPAAPAPAPAPATPNADAIRAEAQRAAADILTLCQRHGLDNIFAADLIGRGVTLDAARGAVLDRLAEGDTLGTRTGATVPAAARDTGATEIAYRDAVTDALMHRHAPGLHQLTDAGREFRGLNLLDMARHALERRGISTRGMSRMELATEALQKRAGPGYHSSADFPFILANVANKTLRSAYDSTPRTFTAWARQATITDFRPVQRTQLAGAPDLLRVPESGEFTYGTMGEGREVYALLTYGRIIGITRQTLINDDLDAFTRIPSAFGASAADLESDLVYSILTSNPLMNDGVALFNSGHGNLGTAGAISETTLAEAYRLFGNQRGLEARQISVQPRYLITPPGTRSVEARKNVTATTPNAVAGVNAFAGRLEPIEEPRLIPAAGADPWFLAADPNRIDTVEYAYLDGSNGVYTETRMGFEVDGMEIKARHDFASKAIDWRGLFRNAGV
ncbi:hypothetical protein P775_16805 [Puniceibacterium antarcticum]|uniref:Peptidase U35 n=1 Tax=Puniceibacterium antarcticum TaxID=1206336 RepID=A0A2G8RBW3_9RHOB|nr:prohead protease/major capsid protein fusion protein [Puniceibacterium antarcticum]PIL19022.1 hypothetical protein P775_16805 [Puniceibacterium antarcticum]